MGGCGREYSPALTGDFVNQSFSGLQSRLFFLATRRHFRQIYLGFFISFRSFGCRASISDGLTLHSVEILDMGFAAYQMSRAHTDQRVIRFLTLKKV